MNTQAQALNQDDPLSASDTLESSAFGQQAGTGAEAEAGSKPKLTFFKLIVGIFGALALGLVLLIAIGKMFGGDEEAEDTFEQSVQTKAPPAQMTTAPQGTDPAPAPAEQTTPEPAVEVANVSQPDPATAVTTGPQQETPESTAVTTAPATTTPDTQAAATVPTPENATASQTEATTDEVTQGRIEALTDDVSRLRDEVKQLRRRQSTRSSSIRASATPSQATGGSGKVEGLTLKAVLDQYAWLQTASGESVMVSPGDSVPGAGTVVSVDPDNGAVQLSDGRVLR